MKSKNTIILVLLILSGIFIRCFYLNAPLWYDEACSWFSASQSFPFGIIDNLLELDLQHTPLYFFGLHFWSNLFSYSEVPMRLFSLIFSIGSIFLIYKITKKLLDDRIAFWSTLIFCVNPLLVLFSVEVRMYQMVMFLVLLSLNFLIDFENNNNKNLLKKLTITNILIPYTYVGGIFYNFALSIFYGKYLKNSDKEKYNNYRKFQNIEWLLLIPYFILVLYYKNIRNTFVISHEGNLQFSHIVDLVRNFFGANISSNVYWPVSDPYNFTLAFCLFVIVPCVYFIYGYIQGFKKSDGFLKVIYDISLFVFVLFIFFALLKINVLTVRYVIYILPVLFILSIAGLYKKFSIKHLNIFLSLYVIVSIISSFNYSQYIKHGKELAFKAVSIESQNLGLGEEDVVILPFGSDAPYYFRSIIMPKVVNFDSHKIVRNPYGIYYDKEDEKFISTGKKYSYIYKKLFEDKVFSQSFYNYFKFNVSDYVPKGRYVLLAFYGSDNTVLGTIDDLRNMVKDEKFVKQNILDVMLRKYYCDIIAMLNLDFKFVKSYQKDNYTYYLYQKL